MAVLYGADQKRAEKEMREALDFEIALANVSFNVFNIEEFAINCHYFQISLPNEKRRNASALYNPIAVKDLQKKYPYNNWVTFKYFRCFFNLFLIFFPCSLNISTQFSPKPVNSMKMKS